MREVVQIPAVMLLTLVAGSPCSAKSIRPLGKLSVLPFVIAVQSIDGAPGRADQEAIVRRLVEAATARAERSLRQQRIAATVERLSLPIIGGDRASESGAAEPPRLAGTLRLPVSLPPLWTGPQAWFRHGPFATAEVELRQADGVVIARAAATLDWREIRWFTGAGRLRRSRPLDEVLIDFARKATDRAIKRLRGDESLFSGP